MQQNTMKMASFVVHKNHTFARKIHVQKKKVAIPFAKMNLKKKINHKINYILVSHYITWAFFKFSAKPYFINQF